MTIKQIEAQSGMSRANIRYYEAEGLLSPARNPNGYRDYSEADLEELKKIRLLRSLHVPLEQIRALHDGTGDLDATLRAHLSELESMQEELDRSQKVCREILGSRESYRTLDAQKYLDSLDLPPQSLSVVPPASSRESLHAPWRRFFARSFDLAVCGTLWDAFLILVCNYNPQRLEGLSALLGLFMTEALLLFLEPLFLHLFGTTPGKWLLGLRVVDWEGRKPAYGDAMERTWNVLYRGLGFLIPVFHLIRLIKSYNAQENSETLDWEYDSALVLRDQKWWRWAALFGAYAAVIGLSLLPISAGQSPRHRGDITTAQFCQNYNRLANYLGLASSEHLDDSGTWVTPENSSVIYLFGPSPADFEITEENGAVREISFRYEADETTAQVVSSQRDQMLLSSLSFACAQDGFGVFSQARRELLELIEDSPFEDFTFSRNGVTVTCDVEYTGYVYPGGQQDVIFLPNETASGSFELQFRIVKDGADPCRRQ